MALLSLSQPSAAAPPPPDEAALGARAQLIVTGTIDRWQRVSWFWQRPQRHRATLKVTSCLKGCETQGPLTLEALVDPGSDGARFQRPPPKGHLRAYLAQEVDGAWRLVEPELYALIPTPAHKGARPPPP